MNSERSGSIDISTGLCNIGDDTQVLFSLYIYIYTLLCFIYYLFS